MLHDHDQSAQRSGGWARPEGWQAAEELSRIRALVSRSARDATGTYYVEGIRQVFRALDARLPLDLILYSEALAPALAQGRVRLARRDGAQVLRVTPEQFRSVSIGVRPSGVGAVLHQHWSSIDDIDPGAGLCWVAVGAVRSPGNFGTLLRTAEAAGAAGVIVLERATDPFDTAVVRAGMGGVFGLGFVRARHEKVLGWAKRHGCHVIGASPRGGQSYAEVSITSPLLVLFGEERKGLTERDLRLCSELVSIRMVGRADSLNVGVAAGIVLFDFLRRRSVSPGPISS